MKKKLFSILLSLAMVVTMMPMATMTAFAEDNEPLEQTLTGINCSVRDNGSNILLTMYTGYDREDYTFYIFFEKIELENNKTYIYDKDRESNPEIKGGHICASYPSNSRLWSCAKINVQFDLDSAGEVKTASLTCISDQIHVDDKIHTYHVSYTAYPIALSAKSHGTMKLYNVDGRLCAAGIDVDVALYPEEGYEPDKVYYYDGQNHNLTYGYWNGQSMVLYWFTMPAKQVEIFATFKPIGDEPDEPDEPVVEKYSVTVQNDGNGTATASPTKAAKGTKVTLLTQPNEGYKFKEWQVVSGGVSVTNNSFTMGEEDVVVKAVFEQRSAEDKTDLSNAEITIDAQKYTGKALKPKAQVVADGMILTEGKDYTITYTSNKNVGMAKAVITGMGYCEGTATGYFMINPKGTSISKLSASKKGFTAKWKAQKTQTTGYQLRYSTSSNMNGSVTKTIKSNKTVSKKITKLKAKKKYYVQVRTYKSVNGTKYYSSWSSKKSIKTK